MEANPYEPPRSQLLDPLAQKFAKRLLFLRDQPVSITLFYRGQGKVVALAVIYFVVVIALCALIQWYPLMFLIMGMFIGYLSTVFALARRSAKIWPYQKKITDWARVVRMADGDTLDLGPPEFIDSPRTVASTVTYRH